VATEYDEEGKKNRTRSRRFSHSLQRPTGPDSGIARPQRSRSFPAAPPSPLRAFGAFGISPRCYSRRHSGWGRGPAGNIAYHTFRTSLRTSFKPSFRALVSDPRLLCWRIVRLKWYVGVWTRSVFSFSFSFFVAIFKK